MDAAAQPAAGSLRAVMPHTAALVDELRVVLGVEWANRLMLQGKAGKGLFWSRETGADGVVREFGSRR